MPRPASSTSVSTRPTSGSRLAIVFGDQLDLEASLIRSLDARDTVLMMEVAAESLHVASHIQRTVLFLSAMRHFAASLLERGINVRYVRLDDPENTGSFDSEIARAVEQLRPTELLCTQPGEWRVYSMLVTTAARLGVSLRVLADDHFITTPQEFATWASSRRSLTMEFFYREQRRRTGYLMTGTGAKAVPEGGEWNFDKENRLPFDKHGPKPRPRPPLQFTPDAITRETMACIARILPQLPGKAEPFGWPVTRADALELLNDFIVHRLASFGPYEDAMWTSEPTLYHSTLSSSLNLKLLNPRECCERAIDAYKTSKAPLQSVEAFVRQIIGWREFIRAVYWHEGESYGERNSLDAAGALPEFYWTGDTDMACMKACVRQVVDTGFAHHIQRLMVTGNFALISGIHPRAVSDWYLGMFVDGVDWVTLPNTLGMVMHADRRDDAPLGVTGTVGTKPYAASGRYIERMSNYCRDCRFDPGKRSGPEACPMTVFYWDFLLRHRERLASNQRMAMVLKNVDRLADPEKTQITVDATILRRKLGISAPDPAL
jgi:deoxyribodipyrimidine photolyase-related protein